MGISHPELRNVLEQQMSQAVGEDQSFLSSPVIEQMFAWKKGQPTLEDLGGELLHANVIDALDHKENGAAYRFNRNYQPYVHQLHSWNALLKDKKSIVVTSGTGSGKTECFMVPILNDLYEEFIQAGQSLTGVRALFLYPLNALINSQQERLDAWTRHFSPSNAIRYCLYNGNTSELKSQETGKQKLHPNQVLTREELRLNPSPILVTNGTMLEYMMVRQIDAPILQKSQGKLRWIVLDEAHSYMGSQAAELAMQLRRVLHAFGVEAKDVRFVATSATIAGTDAEEKLKQFLSEISGQSIENILVIGGHVTTQKYIPVQKPWVGLSETAQSWPLPHANLGYFNLDSDGHVFQYSSGLNGTGFAICMQCGRADSMEESYDGEAKFPSTLTPDRPHKALKALKDGDKFKRPDCGGSSVVKANIHLGCQIKTDVLEIVLKHPTRNEYILNNEDGRIIATTLVVALRQAIATKLGIATDELGYAVKVKKIDDQAVLVLQIFDDLSGGAGFSTTAAHYIAEVLRSLVAEKLNCIDDSCDSVCGKCLLDNTKSKKIGRIIF